ncbi:hypothetical protein [Rhizobium rhizogenes]|uniref:hypothetical protein n=1 Tax=Rhizobium rhizogenes TaxID=359 RepID=UPI001571E43F|nr:hypothetical protein [Rhizobium rhizogenes]NTF46075.1 hypothetical protein [Rhizobium rhizogenes]
MIFAQLENWSIWHGFSHAVFTYFRVFESGDDRKQGVIGWVDGTFADGENLISEDVLLGLRKIASQPPDADGAEELRRLWKASEVIHRRARLLIAQEFNFSSSSLSNGSLLTCLTLACC